MCWYYQLLLCWNATGFVVGSATQANFSRQGFVFGMLSSLLVALYSTSVKKVLHIHTPHTLHTHTHNALRNALLFTHRCLFYLCQKGVTHTHSTHSTHTHTTHFGMLSFLLVALYSSSVKRSWHYLGTQLL
jgi:hypothetical protein